MRIQRRAHFVYIVRCVDGTLYTGYARDLRARVAAHNAGRGAKYTAGRRPVTLVYSEKCRSLGKALSREHAIKRLRRTQKEEVARMRQGFASAHSLRKPNSARRENATPAYRG